MRHHINHNLSIALFHSSPGDPGILLTFIYSNDLRQKADEEGAAMLGHLLVWMIGSKNYSRSNFKADSYRKIDFEDDVMVGDVDRELENSRKPWRETTVDDLIHDQPDHR